MNIIGIRKTKGCNKEGMDFSYVIINKSYNIVEIKKEVLLLRMNIG
jgi:hypothetical protein